MVFLLVLLTQPGAAPGATLGEQRLLLMLTTWGLEPYSPATVTAEPDEAAAFLRRVFLGRRVLPPGIWLNGR